MLIGARSAWHSAQPHRSYQCGNAKFITRQINPNFTGLLIHLIKRHDFDEVLIENPGERQAIAVRGSAVDECQTFLVTIRCGKSVRVSIHWSLHPSSHMPARFGMPPSAALQLAPSGQACHRQPPSALTGMAPLPECHHKRDRSLSLDRSIGWAVLNRTGLVT